MDKVHKCLDDVERKLTKINAIAAKGAASMTVKDVIKLARKGNSINNTMKKGIKDYNGVEPTEAEAKEILVQMDRIVNLTEGLMDFAIVNKPTFDKLHVSGLVKKQLQKSEGTSLALADMLISKTPPSLKEDGERLDKRSKKAFDNCMAAYSNAKGGEDAVDGEDDSD